MSKKKLKFDKETMEEVLDHMEELASHLRGFERMATDIIDEAVTLLNRPSEDPNYHTVFDLAKMIGRAEGKLHEFWDLCDEYRPVQSRAMNVYDRITLEISEHGDD